MLLTRLLNHIERLGNRLPHPTLMFVYLCGLILLLSWVFALLGVSAEHPTTGEALRVNNLLNLTGLERILTQTVINFTSFAPVGTVLVAIMGFAVAEHSGLLSALLRASVVRASHRYLTFFVVLAGVLSSLASDTGYVILLPLAALIFSSAGRHPLAGLAAAFAGVSGGYSANLLIGPLDVMLAAISTEAAHLVAPDYQVNAAGNYYFIAASTLLIAGVGTWVTEAIICRRLPSGPSKNPAELQLSQEERRGLWATAGFSAIFAAMLLWGLLPQSGWLRDPETQSVIASPFMTGIVTVIAFYAALSGLIYGKVTGSYQNASAVVTGMEKHMATMANYLVLMFFAAQFIQYFAWSNLGLILAVQGAGLLTQINLPPTLLLLLFVLLSAVINLFVGSASAKWALLAPVFVPMLLLMGLSPEATQIAYRIGDSSTNLITPLMPYFGVVVAFAQHHQKDLGVGTLITLMLPYSIAFLLAWSLLLLLWVWLGLPLGPGAGVFV